MKTLEEISKLAGVSASTVSRALGGSKLVKAKTALRIQQLALEHGYQINRSAQSLARKQSRIIGMVVPEAESPYFAKLIDVVYRNAKEQGYVVVPTFSGSDQLEESQSLQLLEELRAEAAIIVTGRNGFPGLEAARRIHRRGTALVVLGWAEGSEEFDNVYADDSTGMEALTNHLLAQGHRRISLVCEAIERGPMDRTHGYKRAMVAAGLKPKFEPVMVGDVSLGEALKRALDRQEKPTALIAYHDHLAFGILAELGEMGLKVPEDISVAGFDNLEMGTYVRPRLTTVDFHTELHVAEGLKFLLDRLSGGSETPGGRSVVLEPTVVLRETTESIKI